MAVIRIICVFVLVIFLGISGSCSKVQRYRKPNHIAPHTEKKVNPIENIEKAKEDIVIPIMMHLDKAMTSQMPKIPGSKRIKFKPRQILKEVEKVFNMGSLYQKVRLILVNLRVINNSTGVKEDENVSMYLKSYCEWQKQRKLETVDWYFSVLLSGLNLYYINSKGEKVGDSTGRGYMSKMCTLSKSCAVMRWHGRDVVYLLAHEIAHSLGVYHDGVSNNCPNHEFIMSSQYDVWNPPRYWSVCSKTQLKKFLRSKQEPSSWTGDRGLPGQSPERPFFRFPEITLNRNKKKSWCVQQYAKTAMVKQMFKLERE